MYVRTYVRAQSLYNHLKEVRNSSTVKLGDKGRFDKEQIGVKEPFLVANC